MNDTSKLAEEPRYILLEYLAEQKFTIEKPYNLNGLISDEQYLVELKIILDVRAQLRTKHMLKLFTEIYLEQFLRTVTMIKENTLLPFLKEQLKIHNEKIIEHMKNGYYCIEADKEEWPNTLIRAGIKQGPYKIIPEFPTEY